MKLLLLLIFLPLTGIAQDSLVWTKNWEINRERAVWNLDPFGNLIVSENDQLQKIDSTGKQMFSQSNKHWGTISIIDPSNPMKTMIFSEQQQMLGYVDNTLSKQQENIDLSQYDLSYVTLVATSGQPDKFWVYDQDNSKILLIARNVLQQQRIENISGLLGCKDIIQLFEYENNLYLIDKIQGIYQFDTYGTLIGKWNNVGIKYTQIEGDYAYLLKDSYLQILQLSTEKTIQIILPVKDVTRFKKSGNLFYFSTNKSIQKYSMQLLK